MRFKIHYHDDELLIEGETIEEIRDIAHQETSRRGWNENDCWSEKVSD